MNSLVNDAWIRQENSSIYFIISNVKNILRFLIKNGNIYIDKGDKNEKCFCKDFY